MHVCTTCVIGLRTLLKYHYSSSTIQNTAVSATLVVLTTHEKHAVLLVCLHPIIAVKQPFFFFVMVCVRTTGKSRAGICPLVSRVGETHRLLGIATHDAPTPPLLVSIQRHAYLPSLHGRAVEN